MKRTNERTNERANRQILISNGVQMIVEITFESHIRMHSFLAALKNIETLMIHAIVSSTYLSQTFPNAHE
jgi:hypothetical protein